MVCVDQVQSKTKQEPVTVFHQALDNVAPHVEVRSRRVGGATYQVPVDVRPERRQALAIRWLITAARNRNESTMVDRLSGGADDAANNRGTAVKKREDTHKMAELRASAHYRGQKCAERTTERHLPWPANTRSMQLRHHGAYRLQLTTQRVSLHGQAAQDRRSP